LKGTWVSGMGHGLISVICAQRYFYFGITARLFVCFAVLSAIPAVDVHNMHHGAAERTSDAEECQAGSMGSRVLFPSLLAPGAAGPRREPESGHPHRLGRLHRGPR